MFYLLKSKSGLGRNSFNNIYDDDRDIDFIKHEIEHTGKIEPAA